MIYYLNVGKVRGFKMDEYTTGIDDALDVAVKVLNEAKDLSQAKKRIAKIHANIKEKKFKQMKYAFGLFGCSL
jgi:hypothetical protein